MRRSLFLALLAATLLASPAPVRAQASGDPANKLSLEALTAPQPGDGQHGARRPYRHTAYKHHAARPHGRYYRRQVSRHASPSYQRQHYASNPAANRYIPSFYRRRTR